MAQTPGQSRIESLSRELKQLKETRVFLTHKLQGLEQKRQAAEDWIHENRQTIAVHFNQLHAAALAAKASGDITPLKQQLDASGELKGLLLNIPMLNGQRFSDFLETEIPAGTERDNLLKHISYVPLGLPGRAYGDIDDVTNRKIESETTAINAESHTDPSWWKKITNQDEKDYLKAIRAVKSEMLDIQQMPVYQKAVINSLFDWVEAATLQIDGPPENEDLRYQYEHAEYVINLAQHDFNDTIADITRSYQEVSHLFVQLNAVMENPGASGAPDTFEKLCNSDKFSELSRWYHKTATADLKGTTGISGMLYSKLGNNAQFTVYLNIITASRIENPVANLFGAADNAAADFLNTMTQPLIDRTNAYDGASLDTILETLSTFEYDVEKTIAKTGLLKKIYDSSLSRTAKTAYIAHLATLRTPELSGNGDIRRQIGMALTIADSLKGHDYTPLYTLDLNAKDFEACRTLLPFLLEEVNLYAPVFDTSAKSPHHEQSAYLKSLLTLGAPLSMQKSIKGPCTRRQILRQVFQNTLQDEAWDECVPVLYSYLRGMDTQENSSDLDDIIQSVLLEKNAQGQRIIDRIALQERPALLGSVLSFKKSTLARNNMLFDLADSTDDEILQQKYADLGTALDGQYLEYAENSIIAPDKVTFAWSNDSSVSFQYEKAAYTLPANFTEEEKGELFYALQRYGFENINGHLIRPKNISYATIESAKDGNTILSLYPNNANIRFRLDDPATDTVLDQLCAKGADMVRLDKHLVSLEKMEYVCFEGDIIYFITGDTCVLAGECDQDLKDYITDKLHARENYIQIGDHFINKKTLDTLVYFEEEQKFIALTRDGYIDQDETLKLLNEPYVSHTLSGISCPPQQARNILKTMTSDGYIIREDMAIAPHSVNSIECKENADMVVTFNGQQVTLQNLPVKEQGKLARHLAKRKEFTQVDLNGDGDRIIINNENLRCFGETDKGLFFATRSFTKEIGLPDNGAKTLTRLAQPDALLRQDTLGVNTDFLTHAHQQDGLLVSDYEQLRCAHPIAKGTDPVQRLVSDGITRRNPALADMAHSFNTAARNAQKMQSVLPLPLPQNEDKAHEKLMSFYDKKPSQKYSNADIKKLYTQYIKNGYRGHSTWKSSTQWFNIGLNNKRPRR